MIGIIQLGQGVAVNALLRLGVDLVTIRSEVEEESKKKNSDETAKGENEITHTPRLKKIIALAEKAKEMNHSYVGTEHLLLGILRDDGGLASKILKKLDIDLKSCRNEVLAEIDPNFEDR